MISIFHRMLSIILIFSFCFTLPAQKVFAEEKQLNSKTVTVGYYDNTGTAESDLDTKARMNYSYEYLQMVANYTGWKYEIIYDKRSTLMEKFRKGDGL